jgi:hypothetical protein
VLGIFLNLCFGDPGVITKDNVDFHKKKYHYDGLLFFERDCSTCHLVKYVKEEEEREGERKGGEGGRMEGGGDGGRRGRGGRGRARRREGEGMRLTIPGQPEASTVPYVDIAWLDSTTTAHGSTTTWAPETYTNLFYFCFPRAFYFCIARVWFILFASI